MKQPIKLVGFGVLTWLVPFIVSLFFYTAEGDLAVDKFLFKSIMIVLAGAVGAILLLRVFRGVHTDFVQAGITIGFTWLAINLVLDAIVLIGLLGTGVQEYIYEIGLRYLLIPIMSIAIGKGIAQSQTAAG